MTQIRTLKYLKLRAFFCGFGFFFPVLSLLPCSVPCRQILLCVVWEECQTELLVRLFCRKGFQAPASMLAWSPCVGDLDRLNYWAICSASNVHEELSQPFRTLRLLASFLSSITPSTGRKSNSAESVQQILAEYLLWTFEVRWDRWYGTEKMVTSDKRASRQKLPASAKEFIVQSGDIHTNSWQRI